MRINLNDFLTRIKGNKLTVIADIKVVSSSYGAIQFWEEDNNLGSVQISSSNDFIESTMSLQIPSESSQLEVRFYLNNTALINDKMFIKNIRIFIQ